MGSAQVSGRVGGGGVQFVDELGVVVDRDLNENFFFGSIFVFCAVNAFPRSMSCLISANSISNLPLDIVFDRKRAARTRFGCIDY